MDVLRLRKLSHKSIMGFGKYSDESVSMLMSTSMGRRYLRWVYFHCDRISFLPEIIKELRIEDFQIEKPGKSKEEYARMKERMTEEYQKFEESNPIPALIRKRKRAKIVRNLKVNSLNSRVKSKGSLMSKNHGH